jgi:DNA-binding PadR family transcriptional regulator
MRRGRVFDSGELRLVLLSLIAEQPRHGYDLIKEIEERTGGVYAPSPGVVYPTLTLLEEMSLIDEMHSEGAKKRFAITAEGGAHVTENAQQTAALFAKLDGMGESAAKTDSKSIRRALGNFRQAMQDRLSEEDVSEEIKLQVVAIIDDAAQKIERVK